MIVSERTLIPVQFLEWNDDQDSIAVPIWAGDEVIAAINLTWMHKVASVPQIVKAYLPLLTAAAREISMRLVAD